jgi:colicin import membrane protein
LEALHHAELDQFPQRPATPTGDAELDALRQAESPALPLGTGRTTDEIQLQKDQARQEAEAERAREQAARLDQALKAKGPPEEQVAAAKPVETVAPAQPGADQAAAQLRQDESAREAAALWKKADEDRKVAIAAKADDADTAAATAALEQFESKLPASPEDADKQAAVAALERQKAQEEIARRVENLQKDIKSQPAPGAPPTAVEAPAGPPSKEQRLRDLLRRYNADEISPLEYHTERARIVAEP